jgi:hypothetical protein
MNRPRTLLKIMVDGNAPASARVRAADRILERANQGLEKEDILVRVAAVEQAVGYVNGDPVNFNDESGLFQQAPPQPPIPTSARS